ncbi:phosphatase PAP2 family protein [Actinoplanes teichomyceticus]|uniref:Autotransporter-associated beta strand protein n=1 Tax=Actinoplanes teichomyceticus TaxID=1867 RepID=A0A561WA93_ACTTI|nr:phosphatase PAP2 family protein [Actinoplanes teichomyceticus]TWG20773.1 autotransporter-associated beta strand protein [Actinoplanes teichomyceticus]GIF14429.1 phosphoesterase [Actinoplanes teichomyceticus]
MPSLPVSRRTVLRASAAGAAGLVAGPGALAPAAPAVPAAASPAFVDSYRTNLVANLTAETNAALRILSGFGRVWSTGAAWNSGTVLDRAFLRANIRYVVKATTHRTDAEAARAFLVDRRHQSYSVTAGLGPLAELYRAGALAVTGVTAAPDTTPATTISDAVPTGAPAGSAIGAGSPTSPLGRVVTLVNTVRGGYSSGNPAKLAFQYPRPWRLTVDSEVVDTGRVDDLGYPVYDSEVVVAPALLRQRGTAPADDGGYVSGHSNALFLAALAYAYAVPERFQELVTCAYDLAHTRIVAGMHSPADVIGGRVLATALAAAILRDPENATLKAEARAQALAYFQSRVGADVHGFAHSGADEYADREHNARHVRHRHTYDLPTHGRRVPVTVPAGAEVLLETRLPYLDGEQRREVLRTTASGSGHPVLDGPEQWGRLNLFAAADGYGAFDATVAVTLDAARGGFHAADAWRNDIGGRGGLVKLGSGALTLSGDNSYRGGTTLAGGTLTAAARTALGDGDVTVSGGTLRLAAGGVRVRRDYRQSGGTLAVTADPRGRAALVIDGDATLGRDATLSVTVAPGGRHAYDAPVPVLTARRLRGRFARVVVATPGHRAELVSYRDTVAVRLRTA